MKVETHGGRMSACLLLLALSLTARPPLALAVPPANDNFASRSVFPVATVNASMTGTTVDSTFEQDDPMVALPVRCGGSVWWQWTASASTIVEIRPTGNTSKSVMCGVFAGSSLTTLIPVGINVPGAACRFRTKAGQVYQTAVAMPSTTGNLGFTVTLTNLGPGLSPYDDPSSAPLLETSATQVTASNHNVLENGSREPVDLISTVWWRWRPASAGIHDLSASQNPFPAKLQVYRHSIGSMEGWQAVGATARSVRVRTESGYDYTVGVGLDPADLFAGIGTTTSFTGNVTLSISPYGQAGFSPGNDSFAGAGTLGANDAATAGSIRHASAEIAPPLDSVIHNVSGSALNQTAWYRFVAPASARYAVQVIRTSSGGSAGVRVFEGSTQATLELVAEDDSDDGFLLASFPTLAGQTYHLCIGCVEAESGGDFAVSIVPAPPNDLFAGREMLGNGAEVTATARLRGAGVEDFERHFEPDGVQASVWYQWTAPTTGVVGAAALCRTAFSWQDIPQLTVFTGASSPQLTPVEARTGGKGPYGLAHALTFDAVAGTSYVFRISASTTAGRAALKSDMQLVIKTGGIGTPYQVWLRKFPGWSGPLAMRSADADGDGETNLVEMAMGGDPLDSKSVGLGRVELGGWRNSFDSVMTYRLLKSPDWVGTGEGSPIYLQPVGSKDLIQWGLFVVGNLPAVPTLLDESIAISGSLTTSQQQRTLFLRFEAIDPNSP